MLIKVTNTETGTEFHWTKEKFLDRLYLMREMYRNFEQHDDWEVPLEKDPFYEDPTTESFVGSAQVYLQVRNVYDNDLQISLILLSIS